MTYAVIAEAIVILALIAVLHALQRDNASERRARDEAHDRLVQTMADRIQAPDRAPLASLASFETPDPEPDEMAQVGTITIDESYGEDEY